MSVPHGIDRSGAPGGSGAQGMVGSLNDLSDPGADRILFWDDSVGDLTWLEVSTGLQIVGTSLSVSANLKAMNAVTPSDGQFLVGDGSTWAGESGATARASLGIVDVDAPAALGEFIFGRTASNSASAKLPANGHPLVNGYVDLSVSAGILTVSLLADGGSAPTASNPVWVRIRQGNPEDGTYLWRVATAALSTTISSGSTLGHSNAVASAVYVYAIDNAGAIELAVSSRFFPNGPQSTTAEGGAGGADSQTTLYSTTARTSVPIAPLLRWQSTQTSAGVWAAVTGIKQLFPWPYKAPTVQVFTATGANTYTKPWDLLWAEVEVQGGGGAGGASANTGANEVSAGSGGGGGGYSRKRIAADAIGPTETMTVGTASGTSSFGAHCSATGGSNGIAGSNGVLGEGTLGGFSGAGSGGDVNVNGQDGGSGTGATDPTDGIRFAAGGVGGSSHLGGGGRGGVLAVAGDSSGRNGLTYGGGGGGSASAGVAGAGAAGGAGAQGIGIVTEYYG